MYKHLLEMLLMSINMKTTVCKSYLNMNKTTTLLTCRPSVTLTNRSGRRTLDQRTP